MGEVRSKLTVRFESLSPGLFDFVHQGALHQHGSSDKRAAPTAVSSPQSPNDCFLHGDCFGGGGYKACARAVCLCARNSCLVN